MYCTLCDEGVWSGELNQGKMVRKSRGHPPDQQTAPADTTKALVDALNNYQAQLFVTSGSYWFPSRASSILPGNTEWSLAHALGE